MGDRRRAVGLAALIALLAAGAFFVGRGAHAAPPDPIQARRGVPVGVDHAPGGVVAAADEYLATEQETVERDPGRFAALVSEDYVPALRAGALSAAQGDRQRDPRGMSLWASSGPNFTVIGAHRLDWYGGNAAQVTAWAGQVFWGPGQAPCQAWSLGRVTLRWRDGHWEITAMSTLPLPAPAPATLPQAAPGDDSASMFSSELAGFSPVSYGSPG